MRLVIVAVGDRMPAWVDTAVADYVRRFPRHARVEVITIRPEPRRATRTVEQALAAEAARIESALPSSAYRVVLDERGRELASEELADRLRAWIASGRDVGFVIGGADGLAPAIRSSAALVLRLSRLTLPHGLARVLLVEQLYRACAILANHPYHRA